MSDQDGPVDTSQWGERRRRRLAERLSQAREAEEAKDKALAKASEELQTRRSHEASDAQQDESADPDGLSPLERIRRETELALEKSKQAQAAARERFSQSSTSMSDISKQRQELLEQQTSAAAARAQQQEEARHAVEARRVELERQAEELRVREAARLEEEQKAFAEKTRQEREERLRLDQERSAQQQPSDPSRDDSGQYRQQPTAGMPPASGNGANKTEVRTSTALPQVAGPMQAKSEAVLSPLVGADPAKQTAESKGAGGRAFTAKAPDTSGKAAQSATPSQSPATSGQPPGDSPATDSGSKPLGLRRAARERERQEAERQRVESTGSIPTVRPEPTSQPAVRPVTGQQQVPPVVQPATNQFDSPAAKSGHTYRGQEMPRGQAAQPTAATPRPTRPTPPQTPGTPPGAATRPTPVSPSAPERGRPVPPSTNRPSAQPGSPLRPSPFAAQGSGPAASAPGGPQANQPAGSARAAEQFGAMKGRSETPTVASPSGRQVSRTGKRAVVRPPEKAVRPGDKPPVGTIESKALERVPSGAISKTRPSASKADTQAPFPWAWVAAGLVLLLAVSVGGWWLVGRAKEANKAAEAAAAQPVSIALGLTAQDAPDRVDTAAILVGKPDVTTAIIVDPTMQVEIPGGGRQALSNAPSVNVFSLGDALYDTVDLRVDGTWLLSRDGFIALIDDLGGIDVNNGKFIGQGDITVPAGEVRIGGDQAYLMATYLAEGEKESERQLRWSQVVRGLLKALPTDEPQLRTRLADFGAESRITLGVDQMAAALAKVSIANDKDVVPTLLPTEDLQIAEGNTVKVFDDVRFKSSLDAENLAGVAHPAGDNPINVLVVNNVGTPGIVPAARTRIVRTEGLRYFKGLNAEEFTDGASYIAIPDKSEKSLAAGMKVAEAFGMPADSLNTWSSMPPGSDVAVAAGNDFEAIIQSGND